MTVGPHQLKIKQLRHLDWWKVLFNSGMTDNISVFWVFSKLLVAVSILERASADPLEQRDHTSGGWKGPLAINLKRAHKRVLELKNDPMPLNAYGDIELKRVASIKTLKVMKYH